ncbi:unnamed protein product [Phytomonas sp. EM1]|nr:unnamed protein product [Phytomonas sp. EM1]|eukprot:CCW59994.1 unnamed protein product [Phytomonas sp. isolate EM1]
MMKLSKLETCDEICAQDIPNAQRRLSMGKLLLGQQTQRMSSSMPTGRANNGVGAEIPSHKSSSYQNAEKDIRKHPIWVTEINSALSDATLRSERIRILRSNAFGRSHPRETVSDSAALDGSFPTVQTKSESAIRIQSPSMTGNTLHFLAGNHISFSGNVHSFLSPFLDGPALCCVEIASLPPSMNEENEGLLIKREDKGRGELVSPKASPIRKSTLFEEDNDMDELFRERFQIEKEQRLEFSKIQAAEVSDYLLLARKARVGYSAKFNAKNSLTHLDKIERQIMLDSLEAHECRLKTELLNEAIETRKELSKICNLEDSLFKSECKNFLQDYSALCFDNLLAGASETEFDSELASNYDAAMAEAINREVRWQLEIQRWERRNKQK